MMLQPRTGAAPVVEAGVPLWAGLTPNAVLALWDVSGVLQLVWMRLAWGWSWPPTLWLPVKWLESPGSTDDPPLYRLAES